MSSYRLLLSVETPSPFGAFPFVTGVGDERHFNPIGFGAEAKFGQEIFQK